MPLLLVECFEYVCYKTFCDLLEFLGTVSKFFTNSIFDLVLLVFLCFVFFWKERDIKLEQRYIFAPIFNRDGLRETNRTNLLFCDNLLFFFNLFFFMLKQLKNVKT